MKKTRKDRMAFSLDRLLQAIQDLTQRPRSPNGFDRTRVLYRKIDRYSTQILEYLEGPHCRQHDVRTLYCGCLIEEKSWKRSEEPSSTSAASTIISVPAASSPPATTLPDAGP